MKRIDMRYFRTTLVAVGCLVLISCSRVATGTGALNPAQQQMLDSSLKVSAAAIETGQPVAAGRLYERLSTSFPSAPEPKLGLAYMALHAGDFATCPRPSCRASAMARRWPNPCGISPTVSDSSARPGLRRRLPGCRC